MKYEKQNEGELMEAAGEILNGKKANKFYLPVSVAQHE